jgi:hypothetical protein
LDPNRVFDLVLEAAELFNSNINFLEILSLFNKSNTCHIIGFKFRNYYGKETPASLLNLTATLIKHQYFTVEDLYPHLYPENDVVTRKEHEEFLSQKLREASGYAVVNLNAEEQDQQKVEPKDDKDLPSSFVNNQRLQLIIALLNQDVFDDAVALLDTMSQVISLAIHPDVCLALTKAITRLIDPIYERLSPSNILKPDYDVSAKFTFTDQEFDLLSQTVFALLSKYYCLLLLIQWN